MSGYYKFSVSDNMAGSEIHNLLLQHIEHPLFAIPILSFMEEHCIIFSNDVFDCPEYKAVYEEYKTIVNALIVCFCEDLSISSDEFMADLSRMDSEYQSNSKNGPHPGIQKIKAASDYALFVELMQNLNDQLQREALHIIQQQFASGALVLSDGHISHEEDLANFPTDANNMSEEEIIAMVLKLSADEYKSSQAKFESAANNLPPPEKKIDDKLQPDFFVSDDQPSLSSKTSKFDSSKYASNSENLEHQDTVDSEEFARRQSLLREQRDKLMARKREERQQQIKNLESFTRDRPASAKAAKSILDNSQNESSAEEEKRKKLERRRALANKLKTEVVEKK